MKLVHQLMVALLLMATSMTHVAHGLGGGAMSPPRTAGPLFQTVFASAEAIDIDDDGCPPGETSRADGGCCCPHVSLAALIQPTTVVAETKRHESQDPLMAGRIPLSSAKKLDPPVPRPHV